ncbi:MAG: hypothetical protein QME66_08225 [Candidatus Eisenbacteria bacterium]|nr:hypothetical protein [Candidatus Eisenbacteria bacterium]
MNRLIVKPGVVLPTMFLEPVLRIISAVCKHYWASGDPTVRLTSGIEGEHGENSYHYSMCAFDFDVVQPKRPTDVQGTYAKIRAELGPEYDVLVEGNHLHVEWNKPR